MNTANHNISHSHLTFWAGLSVFVTLLLGWQMAGGMTLVSLPGLFLPLGMLCFLSREFWPPQQWLHKLFFLLAMVLFASSLIDSARLLLVR